MPKIRDLAEGLKSQIDVLYDRYDGIVLVCHSLGGLVARKYLLEEVKAGRPLRVKKLLLFAVPHNGAALASIADDISWQHRQLKQLCRNSEFVEELNQDWAQTDMLHRIDVHYVVAGQDRLVDKQSATHQWGNQNVTMIVDAGHISLVKPTSREDVSYQTFRKFVLGIPPVFLSMGGGRTEQQERFVESLRGYLRGEGLEPHTVEDYSDADPRPLVNVASLMRSCYGILVVAFERTFIEKGQERRAVEGRRVELVDVKLPPVWNQIEGSMAYALDLPLFVVAERGLLAAGVLESKYDWTVKWVTIDSDVTKDPEFRAAFKRWRNQVCARRGDRAT